MEHYYFIVKKGDKLGPFKLAELKQQIIYFDELVWRSDNEHWKRASEYEDLQDIFIFRPPLTPKEQKATEINNAFKNKIAKEIVILYILTSILISLFSYLIAQSSWDKYLEQHGGKNSLNSSYSSGPSSYTEGDLYDPRYPSVQPGENMEDAYGNGQALVFRSFKAFYSTVYLTPNEQKNSGTLFLDLMLSSFVSLSFIFLILGLTYYVVRRNIV